ncbi:hypothetical protein LF817_15935 [Halobacillus sp. A1]|uniref:hypothetical protein n=1 Tax=Halobacillus sp. A1 TaxID=2880262 RepID=UPI0020A6B5D3|nr:hypothetical protein [Halobacillus sp. A1]MCP3032816.1 hypothetical protein [Halobacillus sp. A1]
MESITHWMRQVNTRKDLLKKWKERPIVLFIYDNEDRIPVTIDSQQVRIDFDYDFHCQVHIDADPEIMEQIIEGEVKLTSLPSANVHVEGKLRDLLYVESLFLLAR